MLVCAPDTDQGDALRGHTELGEAGEDLDDLELVVEVRLPPQHVRTLAMGCQDAVPVGASADPSSQLA
ncbi:hypothetical protein ACH4FE_09300 [Streptomyces celluloflavus]|uniref:hypothetical protein n=1 Tax=Streptomyces celluloflavus TaxID=58344 RepID=UPI00379F5CD7